MRTLQGQEALRVATSTQPTCKLEVGLQDMPTYPLHLVQISLLSAIYRESVIAAEGMNSSEYSNTQR